MIEYKIRIFTPVLVVTRAFLTFSPIPATICCTDICMITANKKENFSIHPFENFSF